MLTVNEYYDAMKTRISRRAYLQQPMDAGTAGRVGTLVDEVNQRSGLSLRFVTDGTPALSAVASKGMFSGAPSYIALIGPDSPAGRTACGYYGEQLLLECVALGLGTCWVAGTYKKESVLTQCAPAQGEALFGVLAVGLCPAGQTAKERLLSLAIHKKQVPYTQMIAQTAAPLAPALEQALKELERAPSALNKHSPRFSYENGMLSAWVEQPDSQQSLDLGIAKFHIQMSLAAQGISLQWNDANQIVFVTQ